MTISPASHNHHQGGRRNLLTVNQADVETDTTGFTSAYGATLARSTTQAVSGSASIRLTATQTNGMYCQTTTSGLGARIYGGLPYTGVVTVYANSNARNTFLQIIWQNAAGGTISSTSGTASNATVGAWKEYSATAVAPSTAVYAALNLCVEPTTSVGEIFYADKWGLWTGSSTIWVD